MLATGEDPRAWARGLRNVVVAACITIMAGCEDRTPPVPEEQSIRPARIHVVEDTTQTRTYTFVGRVDALQTIDVSFEVAGPLQQLPILEGQIIPTGGLIAALDAEDFELAVREAEVQVKIARQDLERKQRVLEQRGIARSVVDDAQSLYELQLVRLRQARERLDDSKLFAPFDAYVARRFVDNYTNISIGTRIARLHDLNKLLVVASVPETIVARVSADQLVDLHARFDFLPEHQFPLTVYENRGEADGVAQTYEVSLMMDNPPQWNILPGMTATVHVLVREPVAQSVVFVPASALVAAEDKSFFVWLYHDEERPVERRVVKTGIPTSAGVPVREGLKGGERVVASGAASVQEGMRVRPLSGD